MPIFIVNVILAILGFGLLILVHEFGHFIAAKWIGVRVEAFSLGFGPSLSKKWGETEYRLSLVPLGGYVKLAGGEQRKDGHEFKHDELMSRPPGQRALVFAAGAGLNIVLAFAAFVVAYGMGVPTTPAVVGTTAPGSPAWHAGLMPGDHIVSINNREGFVDFEDLLMATLLADPAKGILLGVERDGERMPPVRLLPEYDADEGVQRVGIFPPSSPAIAATVEVAGRDPVREAGMKIGDRILRAALAPEEGEPEWVAVERPGDIEELVERSAGRALLVEYARGNGEQEAVAQTTLRPMRGDPARGRLLGLGLGSNVVAEVRAGSWLGRAGLAAGDKIVALDGNPIASRKDLAAAAEAAAGREATLAVKRPAQQAGNGLAHLPVAVPERPEVDADVLFKALNTVDFVLPGFPAERVGVRPGDQLLRYGRADIEKRQDLIEEVNRLGGGPAEVAWGRDGEVFVAEGVQPEPMWDSGIMWRPLEVAPSAGPFAAIRLGTRKATQWVARIYLTLGAFATRRVAARHLGGPIAIARITYAAAQHGLPKLVYFLGMISLNLGLINLLPIPVLDGGHLVFTGIEKLTRRPVSERLQMAASYVGLVLILSLVLFTTWNDIVRLVTGG